MWLVLNKLFWKIPTKIFSFNLFFCVAQILIGKIIRNRMVYEGIYLSLV